MASSDKLIFTGEFYEAWCAHMVASIHATSDIRDLLCSPPSEIELECLDLEHHEYEKKHVNFMKRQESARSFVFTRVTLPILDTLRHCYTLNQIFERLDNDYRPLTEAAGSMARRRFYSYHFRPGGDMRQFVHNFRTNGNQFRDSGQRLSQKEEIKQLISALPAEYVPAINSYRLHVSQHGESYQMLQRILIDHYERDLSDKQLLPRYFHQANAESENRRPQNTIHSYFRPRNPQNEHPRNSNAADDTTRNPGPPPRPETDFVKQMRCYKCSGFGHPASDCSSALKPEAERKPPLQTYEEKKKAAHALMVLPSEDTQPQTPKNNVFLLDTGAFQHMTYQKHLLENLKQLPESMQLTCASRNTPLLATHVGEMLIDVTTRFGEERQLHLREVLYVPDLDADLLSEHVITKSGRYSVQFTQTFADVYDSHDGSILFSAERHGTAKYVAYKPIKPDSPIPNQGAYPVQASATSSSDEQQPTETEPVAAPNTPTEPTSEFDDAWLWHRRLGHISRYFIHLFGDPICWRVKRQTLIAASSTAAELIAVHDSLDDVRFMHLLMQEIYSVTEPVRVWEDNTSTAAIILGGKCKNDRALRIKCYDVLLAAKQKEIVLADVSTTTQWADCLTKALSRDKLAFQIYHLFCASLPSDVSSRPRIHSGGVLS